MANEDDDRKTLERFSQTSWAGYGSPDGSSKDEFTIDDLTDEQRAEAAQLIRSVDRMDIHERRAYAERLLTGKVDLPRWLHAVVGGVAFDAFPSSRPQPNMKKPGGLN